LAEENKARASVVKIANDCVARQQEMADLAIKLNVQIAQLQKELEDTKKLIERDKKGKEEAIEQLKQLPDRTPDIAAVKEKIAKADDTNRKVRENAARTKLEADVNSFRGEYQKLTDKLTKIAEERAEAVAKAKWPVPGMELTENGLLMNGLPFEQASTSQRIMASVKVGMALNPKLRLLVCQHGSDLDNDTLDALAKVVEEHKFQLLIELVTRSKEDEERCAVVIADGSVVGAIPDADDSE